MRVKRFFTILLIAAFATLCLTGCGSVNITSVDLLADAALEKGDTLQLDVNYGADQENANVDAIAKAAEGLLLTWSSSEEAVATVSDSGLVTAVGGGEATITASVQGANIQSTCKVTVSVPLESIDVPKTIALVIHGENTAELKVKPLPEDATGVALQYVSSDEGVAKVDANGKVTAVANGECVITVSCGDIQAETTVKVDTAPVALAAKDVEVVAGQTANVEVTAEGEDITVGLDFTYTSADEEIATVDKDGVVTGVAAGETAVTVENELGQKADCKVEVTEPVKQQPAANKPSGNTGAAGNAGTTGGAATTPSQPSGGNETPAPAPEQPAQPAPQPDPAPAPEQPAPEPEPAPVQEPCRYCGSYEHDSGGHRDECTIPIPGMGDEGIFEP